jgi:hypothetical protein
MMYLVKLSFGDVLVSELSCSSLQESSRKNPAMGIVDDCSDATLTSETLVSVTSGNSSWTERVVLISNVPRDQATPSSIDYSQFSAAWSIAFVSVVGLYLISHKIALVLGIVRSA